MLRDLNCQLSSPSNSAIYTSLATTSSPTPALSGVCNNPEVSFFNLNLSSLKVDTKFTTST